MYLKLTTQDIQSSTSIEQLRIKHKYLTDTFLYTPELSTMDRFEIQHLILLIEYRLEEIGSLTA